MTHDEFDTIIVLGRLREIASMLRKSENVVPESERDDIVNLLVAVADLTVKVTNRLRKKQP